MDSQKRLLLALGLSFLLTMVYMTFFVKPPSAARGGTEAGLQAGAPALAVDAGAAAAPPASDLLAVATDGGEPAPPVKEVTRALPNVHFTFSSEGAGLRQAQLQGNKMREQSKVTLQEGLGRLTGKVSDAAPPMEMAVPPAGLPLPLSVSVVGPQPFPANARYSVDETDPDKLVFHARAGTWEIQKTVEWAHQGDELRLTIALKNVGVAAAAGELGLHYSRAIAPEHEEKGSFFGGVGNQSRSACLVAEKFEKLVPGKEDPPPAEFRGPISFFGIDQQYFLAAIFPLDAARTGRCALSASSTLRSADAFFPVQVAPGETVTQRFGAYVGPKDVGQLSAVSGEANPSPTGYTPELEKTVDFGWWAVICKVLLTTLKFFHKWVGNWGVAIILLTVAVKILLMPLTHKQMVSAEAMKKLQPRMEEIKKKFPDDKERQNVETMKLYQEAKVNPLGGCLPLLFQFPIWGALYTTLRVSYELYREPFISPVWVDLTYKDPTYLIPVLLGITMVLTQRLQPQMMDAAQARMMTYVMPVFFTAIMINYPAGLGLYIFTNNLLTIVQQYGLRRYLEKKGVVAPRINQKAKGRA